MPAAAPSSANAFPAIYVVRARTERTATKGRSRRSCWRGWGPRRASLLLLELAGDGNGGGLLRLNTYTTIWCKRIAEKVSGTCACSLEVERGSREDLRCSALTGDREFLRRQWRTVAGGFGAAWRLSSRVLGFGRGGRGGGLYGDAGSDFLAIFSTNFDPQDARVR